MSLLPNTFIWFWVVKVLMPCHTICKLLSLVLVGFIITVKYNLNGSVWLSFKFSVIKPKEKPPLNVVGDVGGRIAIIVVRVCSYNVQCKLPEKHIEQYFIIRRSSLIFVWIFWSGITHFLNGLVYSNINCGIHIDQLFYLDSSTINFQQGAAMVSSVSTTKQKWKHQRKTFQDKEWLSRKEKSC